MNWLIKRDYIIIKFFDRMIYEQNTWKTISVVLTKSLRAKYGGTYFVDLNKLWTVCNL